eukprot:566370-Pyramimonas_sp.AAC.1
MSCSPLPALLSVLPCEPPSWLARALESSGAQATGAPWPPQEERERAPPPPLVVRVSLRSA